VNDILITVLVVVAIICGLVFILRNR